MSSNKVPEYSQQIAVSTLHANSSTDPALVDIESCTAKGSAEVSDRPDPFQLRNGLKTDEEITQIREGCRQRKNGKRLEKFYRKQNDLIVSFLKTMDEHTEEGRLETVATRIPIKIAVWGSLAANFSLCVLQLYAAASAASLSLLATGIDSVFDLGSSASLVWVNWQQKRMSINKWPVGGARLETIGNIIYGSLMSSVNLVVVVESAQNIITHRGSDLKEFHIPSLVAVGAALGIKFLLFLYCHTLRKKSSQVRILWEDHRNDLFINGFGLLMSAGGSKLRWWLDPMGAILIALLVIASWCRTIYLQFQLLAGKSAPQEFIQRIIYNAMTFNDDIEKIDTVRAYHSGPEYFVEVDVVMPADTPLWKAHDISQQLQDKIESLPHVERAFVHVDHEWTHKPEHRKADKYD